MYVCQACRSAGKDFSVPADPVGVALMQQHLLSEHDVKFHRAMLPESEHSERPDQRSWWHDE